MVSAAASHRTGSEAWALSALKIGHPTATLPAASHIIGRNSRYSARQPVERLPRGQQQHGKGQWTHRVDDDPIHRKAANLERRIAVVAIDAAGQNWQFDGDINHRQHTHPAPQLAASHTAAQTLQYQIWHPAEENDVNAQAPQRNLRESVKCGPLTDDGMPHQSQHIVDRFVEVRHRSPDEQQRQRK